MSATQQSSAVRFGIEFLHSQPEVTQAPPNVFATEHIRTLAEQGLDQEAAKIIEAAGEIESIVSISRTINGNQTEELADIFTANQILEMQDRVHLYLGRDVATHLDDIKTPAGYPFYVTKLGAYFYTTNRQITADFGAFERRHTDPKDSATGPFERNSRDYAILASDMIIKSLHEYYGAGFTIDLKGPTKKVEGSRISWERGVAESQFLVLDYVRDLMAHGITSRQMDSTMMSVSDLEVNIANLIRNRRDIERNMGEVNPFLAEETKNTLDQLAGFTIEVFHRGRMGTPMFKKNPKGAQVLVSALEALLNSAAAIVSESENQEDIPILEP